MILVILQASRGDRSYSSDAIIRQMVSAVEEMYPTIPIWRTNFKLKDLINAKKESL